MIILWCDVKPIFPARTIDRLQRVCFLKSENARPHKSPTQQHEWVMQHQCGVEFGEALPISTS